MEAEKITVAVGFGTSIGQTREINEDSFCVFTPYPGSEDTAEFTAVLGVADGMGGHKAGDLASSFVVEKLNAAFVQGRYKDKYGMLSDLTLVLKNVVRDINQELYLLSKKDKSPGEMGSTLTFGVIKDRAICVAHVGDSRCYALAGGKIEQLTKDHSWVAEQVRYGVLSKEEATGHPRDNVITQAMGIDPNIEPQVVVREVRGGEQYIFCTDGLTRHVSDREILEAVSSNSHPQRACDYLLELANQRGGEDNITIVLGYIGNPLKKTREEEAVKTEKTVETKSFQAKARKMLWPGILGLLLFAGSFFLGSVYQQFRLAKKVQGLLMQGQEYFEAGELDKAALLAQSVLKMDKGNNAALELMDKITKMEERRKE